MARKPQDPKTSQKPENNFKPDEVAAESAKTPVKRKQPSQKGKPQRRPPVKALEPVAPATADEVPATEEQIKEALDNGVTPFELQLVEAYLTCFNGSKAYKQIKPEVTQNTADTCSAQVLNRPRVTAYIAKRMSAMFKRTEESQDRLINQYLGLS